MGHKNVGLCLIPAITNGPTPSGNRWLVSGSEDGSIGVWDVQRRKKGGDPTGMVQVMQLPAKETRFLIQLFAPLLW